MPGLLDPRPVPTSHAPALVGTAVVVIAAPVFVVAGWPLDAWGLAAALWVAGQLLMLVLRQLPLGIDNLGASGRAAFGRMFRAIGVMTVLIVVTATDPHLGLPAVAVYVLAYTAEFCWSLMTYFGGEART